MVLSFLKRWFGVRHPGTIRYQRRRQAFCRLALEQLEDRIMLASGLADNAAILLLDPSSKGALTVAGQGNLRVTGHGAVVIDSSNSAAALATGQAQVSADEFDITGVPGTQTSDRGTFQGVIHNGVAAVPDPLASLSAPAIPSTMFPAVNDSRDEPLTLSPGTYVGGIKISERGSVSLLPGLYYLQGGGLSITDEGSLSGTGVTIYNAPSSAANAISFTGKAKVQLTPVTTGTYQGITIFQERRSSVPIHVTATGRLQIAGSIYAAGATVDITDNSSDDDVDQEDQAVASGHSDGSEHQRNADDDTDNEDRGFDTGHSDSREHRRDDDDDHEDKSGDKHHSDSREHQRNDDDVDDEDRAVDRHHSDRS